MIRVNSRHSFKYKCLERPGLNLKQGEWNTVKIGHEKYLNKCKRVHFKNIAVETKAWISIIFNWKMLYRVQFVSKCKSKSTKRTLHQHRVSL